MLGGNGRTMTLALVISEFPNKYKKYKELLIKKSGSFGVDAKKIEGIEYPVLVRVINTDKKKNCNYYSRIFNENMNNKLDELDLAVSYVNSLGVNEINGIAQNIAKSISWNNVTEKTSLAEVMNHREVLPYLLDVLNNAKLINDTNRKTYITYIGNKQQLTESAVPLVRNIFYAMLFEDRQTIEYAKSNPNIKVERIFGSLIEIKSFNNVFNIMPQLKSAIIKMALQQSTTIQKITADDVYSQVNMFAEYQAKYIEYLCMRLIELPEKAEQQRVLQNYIKLVKNFTQSMWTQAEVRPDILLETAFDNAKVKLRLQNLDDGRYRKRNTKLADKPQTLSDRITNWFKNDLQKKYRWQR